MKLEIKVSTVIVFILAQTFLACMFYAYDRYVDGVDAIITFIASIPLTIFIQWMRDEFSFFDFKK